MTDIKSKGINTILSASWLLVTSDGHGNMMPSAYANAAKATKAAGLDSITWSIEHSDPLANGGGW